MHFDHSVDLAPSPKARRRRCSGGQPSRPILHPEGSKGFCVLDRDGRITFVPGLYAMNLDIETVAPGTPHPGTAPSTEVEAKPGDLTIFGLSPEFIRMCKSGDFIDVTPDPGFFYDLQDDE